MYLSPVNVLSCLLLAVAFVFSNSSLAQTKDTLVLKPQLSETKDTLVLKPKLTETKEPLILKQNPPSEKWYDKISLRGYAQLRYNG